MSYTKEQLEELRTAYRSVCERRDQLVAIYVTKAFRNDKSREYSKHGFSRRLRMLMHCIDRVFAQLPPDTVQPPNHDDVLDATVYLQAFVFNAFACIDNLAHIWVHENGVKDKKGKPLPDRWVGFGKRNKLVLESLTPAFRDYLTVLEPWCAHLVNTRHALAHRIPLYIPPYYVSDDKLNEYHTIGARIYEALKRRDYEEVGKLEDEQRRLKTFEPVATHSFPENAPIVFFHFQMISDYNTVEEIARKMVEELGLLPQSALNTGPG